MSKPIWITLHFLLQRYPDKLFCCLFVSAYIWEIPLTHENRKIINKLKNKYALNLQTIRYSKIFVKNLFWTSWGHDEARNKSLGSLRIYTDRAVEKKYKTVAEGALKVEKLSKQLRVFFGTPCILPFWTKHLIGKQGVGSEKDF